jgi:hypothetical protein
MKRSIPRAAALVLVLAAVGAGPARSQGAADVAGKYIGATKCKMCHNKPAEGAQYDLWLKSGHANAFKTLAGEKAKAEAAKQGIADPQKDAKCLKCHATAAAVLADLAVQKITLAEGVSCESCHGPGSGYYKKKTMEDITAGTLDGKTVGLIEPTEAKCRECHRPEGNSFFKDFVFAERVKKIAHPKPAAPPPAAAAKKG